jgi:hypothetical protein
MAVVVEVYTSDMRILAGTREGLREVSAPDRAAAPDRGALAGHVVTALARDGGDWWALAGGRRLWRGDGEHRWTEVAEVAGPEGTCLLPTPEGLLVGTAHAGLLRLGAGGLAPVAPFERAEGRAQWYTPWGDPPDTRSLARGADGALYANIHVGGVLRSRDAGGSWAPTLDIELDVHQVLADPAAPGRVLAAAAAGLVATGDGGTSWQVETEGLHARYCRAVALAGDTVLLSASSGPGGRRAALYRRERGAAAFERCRAGLPQWFGDNVDTHCLVALGETAALGTEDGRVYLSRDAGRGWELVAKGLPPVTCLALS